MKNSLSKGDYANTYVIVSFLIVISSVLWASISAQRNTIILLGVFLAAIVLWITKPVPYTVTSLSCMTLLYVLGVTNSFNDAASGFQSRIFFFMFMLILIGNTISKTNIDDWLASKMMSKNITPTNTIKRLVAILLILSFLLPSGIARVVAFIPIVDNINETFNNSIDSDFRKVSYYIIGHLNPMISLAVMTGGAMPLIAAELTSNQVRSVSWVNWMFYMLPPAGLLFIICAIIATIIYNPNGVENENQLDTSGSLNLNNQLSKEQKLVFSVLLVAITIWIIGSFINIPAILPAILIIFVFSLPNINIITIKDIKSVNWDILFLVGATVSFLNIIEEIGAFDPLNQFLNSVLPTQAPQPLLLLILFFIAILLRSPFSSIAAAFILIYPILLESAKFVNINLLYFSLSLPFLFSATVLLPFNNPAVLIAYENGPLTKREVFLFGLMTLFVSVGVITIGWLFYWPAIENF